ncbi:unnamed protein product [Amoebophrya sp. A120]|nr:unnamed protein product [Amoebophrya sp. A120]|eukprot:GSA120T00010567001.1
MNNAAVGFLLCLGAGSATALGASLVFHNNVVKLANKRVLASGLALAAGVMLYISFIEIFYKAVDGFQEVELEQMGTLSSEETAKTNQEDKAYKQAVWRSYLTFLSGVVLMMLLDKLVHRLAEGTVLMSSSPSSGGAPEQELHGVEEVGGVQIGEHPAHNEDDLHAGALAMTSSEVVITPERMMAEDQEDVEDHNRIPQKETTIASSLNKTKNAPVVVAHKASVDEQNKVDLELQDLSASQVNESASSSTVNSTQKQVQEQLLSTMALKTALAIALHNFPEGLATFIATLDSVEVGAAMAFGIAIHNIPEGLCVAIPVFYATNNRRKAFFWGLFSGLSEPLAALLCWAFLKYGFDEVNGTIYGILFALVAGMMVYISLHELLPTAYRYDPKDAVVTISWLFGMAIIGASLLLLLPDGER